MATAIWGLGHFLCLEGILSCAEGIKSTFIALCKISFFALVASALEIDFRAMS